MKISGKGEEWLVSVSTNFPEKKLILRTPTLEISFIRSSVDLFQKTSQSIDSLLNSKISSNSWSEFRFSKPAVDLWSNMRWSVDNPSWEWRRNRRPFFVMWSCLAIHITEYKKANCENNCNFHLYWVLISNHYNLTA